MNSTAKLHKIPDKTYERMKLKERNSSGTWHFAKIRLDEKLESFVRSCTFQFRVYDIYCKLELDFLWIHNRSRVSRYFTNSITTFHQQCHFPVYSQQISSDEIDNSIPWRNKNSLNQHNKVPITDNSNKTSIRKITWIFRG